MIPPIEIGDPRLPEKYWAKIKVNEETDCWIWTGTYRNKESAKRYAVLSYNSKTYQVASLLREIFIPEMYAEDWRTYMSCQDGMCVNPAHLTLIDRHKCFRGEEDGKYHVRDVDKFGNCIVCRNRRARLRTEKLRKDGKNSRNRRMTNVIDNKKPKEKPKGITVFNDRAPEKIWRPPGWSEQVKVS